MKLINKISNALFKCEYANTCDNFSSTSFTCNTPGAEREYCGIYRKLSQAKESQK